MCYLGGSKLSKKSTFKFVPIRNGIEGLAATCEAQCLIYLLKYLPTYFITKIDQIPLRNYICIGFLSDETEHFYIFLFFVIF